MENKKEKQKDNNVEAGGLEEYVGLRVYPDLNCLPRIYRRPQERTLNLS